MGPGTQRVQKEHLLNDWMNECRIFVWDCVDYHYIYCNSQTMLDVHPWQYPVLTVLQFFSKRASYGAIQKAKQGKLVSPHHAV